jgi:DNA-binding SARP family transcriptional activator/tetratricopeptide (TPR) repeat protein
VCDSGPMLRFRVLGPAEVLVDGHVVPVQGGKLLTVLAGLLLRANQVVSVEQLGRWLWDDAIVDWQRARATVQEYIRRLRRLIGSDDVIRTVPGGYLIEADDESLDLFRFRSLAAAGRQATETGELGAAAERLTAALELWRGPALSNVDSPTLVEVTHLAELWLQVREQWADALLGLGRHELVIPELRRLTKEHPLREKLWEQLMIALYRDGRQAEAFAVYEEIRRVLADELGIDPGASLRGARRTILANEELQAEQRERPPRQLPIAPATFIGRAAEWDLVVSALAVEHRYAPSVVAIYGAGGVGKSALAVRAGHLVSEHYPDGQLYVDLQGSSPGMDPLSPLEVLRRFMSALGVVASAVPAGVEEAAARFRSLIGDRRMLLVLDNAADSAQVRPLLPAGPACAVLITSRSVLSSLVDATHVGLEVLRPEESVALLAELDPTGRAAAKPELTARLADLCDHLPLALRITAARVTSRPDWPLATFVRRLSDERHRLDHLGYDNLSVRACFQASYDALASGAPADRVAARAFRLLGLPSGPDISLPVAARLLDLPEPAAERVLDRLVDAQLWHSPVPGRFRIHDLVRLYARELAERELPESERDAALERTWRCYLATAVHAGQLLRPGYRADRVSTDPADALPIAGYAQATTWLADESGNLLAAARQAASASGDLAMITVALATALFTGMIFNAQYLDLRRLDLLALDIARVRGDRAAEGQLLQDLGVIVWRAGDGDDALALWAEALAVRRAMGDRTGEAITLYSTGNAQCEQGRYPEALRNLTRALEISRETGYRPGEALALNALGEVNQHLGRLSLAIDLQVRSLAIQREMGDRLGEAVTLVALGDTQLNHGRYAEAIASFDQALAVSARVPGASVAVWALAQQGEAYRRAGDAERAVRICERALELSKRTGVRQEHGQVLWRLGNAVADLGDIERARRYWREALPIFENLGASGAAALRRLLSGAGRR